MTDDWDFYFLRVEDKAASTYVDLGAIEFAPVANLPFMAYVRLNMNAPRADGLSSQEEFDTLIEIEDALKAQLVSENSAYVGRCTTNACRDFFFYRAQAADWTQRVADCMDAFPSYRYESGTREEPDWSSYLEYLYPSDADRQTIENRKVCAALERAGDTLQASRELDHWAYFLNAQSRSDFVAEAATLGFAVRALGEPDEDDPHYSAQLWRADVPSYQAIDGITLPLFNLAAKHAGHYDGWETMIVA